MTFQTPEILSEKEYRGFWITFNKYDDGYMVIKVGRTGENLPFMIGRDKNTWKSISYVGLNAWSTRVAYKILRKQINLLEPN